MPAQSGSLQQAEPALDRQREGDELASLSSVLVVFYTLYFAASLLVPIAAAVLLSMLLAPAAQFLERLHMPRLLASAVVVVARGRRHHHGPPRGTAIANAADHGRDRRREELGDHLPRYSS